MPQQTTPFVEGKYGWSFGESGWNGGMDENIVKFSYLFDRNLDGVVASLPTPLVNGQAYFLTTDNRVYYSAGGIWRSSSVPKWFTFIDKSTGDYLQYNGSALVPLPGLVDSSTRLSSVEAVLDTLGTAAFEDSSYFATVTQITDAVDNLTATDISYSGGTVDSALSDIGQLNANSGLESRMLSDWISLFVQKTDGPIYVASRMGVDVTGATAGASALNNLLQDVPAGSLVIIDGLIRTDSPILVPKEGVSIRGLNRKSSGIRSYGTGPIIQSATQNTQTLKFVSLSDMLLMKNSTA